MQATTIDEVISILDDIILTSEKNQDPLGYFAVLYRKVTLKVKEGIAEGFFDDGPRMEEFDIVFANRYIAAYNAYQQQQDVTLSWQRAFVLSKKYWPIVLQHLLIGMNAHINLDLGIAAAQIMKGKDIQHLKSDFDKINTVLSSLVNDVQQDLADIWPMLKKVLQWTKKADDFLIDFSMNLARDGAWKFAVTLADKNDTEIQDLIKQRDIKVAEKAKLISNPGVIARFLFGIIRLGERGSVAQKIEKLKK